MERGQDVLVLSRRADESIAIPAGRRRLRYDAGGTPYSTATLSAIDSRRKAGNSTAEMATVLRTVRRKSQNEALRV
jgi:hypothetical protein